MRRATNDERSEECGARSGQTDCRAEERSDDGEHTPSDRTEREYLERSEKISAAGKDISERASERARFDVWSSDSEEFRGRGRRRTVERQFHRGIRGSENPCVASKGSSRASTSARASVPSGFSEKPLTLGCHRTVECQSSRATLGARIRALRRRDPRARRRVRMKQFCRVGRIRCTPGRIRPAQREYRVRRDRLFRDRHTTAQRVCVYSSVKRSVDRPFLECSRDVECRVQDKSKDHHSTAEHPLATARNAAGEEFNGRRQGFAEAVFGQANISWSQRGCTASRDLMRRARLRAPQARIRRGRLSVRDQPERREEAPPPRNLRGCRRTARTTMASSTRTLAESSARDRQSPRRSPATARSLC